VEVDPWRPLDATERHAVESEAAGFPIPEAEAGIVVRWGA
jgi:hypothetical protein